MWLESHANLARHPKTRRLMKLLGWSLPDTIGNLHLLWWWALDFAPTGDLTRYTPEELTPDLDLLGATPDQFIEAMVAAGFLDRDSDGVIRIHDWQDYKRPKPRRKSAGSSRPGEAGAASSRRPSHEERNQNLPVPPRRDEPQPTPKSHARLNTQSVLGAVAPSCTPHEHQPEQHAPPKQEPEDAILASQRAALDRLNTQPHKLRPSTQAPIPEDHVPGTFTRHTSRSDVGVAPAPPINLTEAEELQTELTARLRQLPGFAKHWWPLYLDFHKKAGTPLDKNQRANVLDRFNKDPLIAIAQIKRDITQSIRNGTQWSGLLEHAP